MKTWITVLCAVAVLTGCAKKDPGVEAPQPVVEAPKVVIDADELEERGGLAYFEEKPFTGIAVEEKNFLGQKFKRPFKDGKEHGLSTWWHENGKKFVEVNYKDGIKHGLETNWYKNGQKEYEVTYKDGEPDGLETNWHTNGQMSSKRTWKDRKVDGLSTIWYENGEKEWEANFKDGKLVEGSEKQWNEKGELQER